VGIRGAAQEWAHGAAGLLHLPERIAPMLNLTNRVERAHASQRHEFLAIEFRHLPGQVIYICKRHAAAPRGQQRLVLDLGAKSCGGGHCNIRLLFDMIAPIRSVVKGSIGSYIRKKYVIIFSYLQINTKFIS
jgi:hypothetical protein